MALLGKKFDSALEILILINSKATLSPISSKEISEETNLSLRYIETIIQFLVQNKILRSVRGAKGGYLLARDRRKISLKDIYINIQDMESESYYDKYPNSKNILKNISQELKKDISKTLSDISLKDIAIKYDKEINQSKNNRKKSSDFVI